MDVASVLRTLARLSAAEQPQKVQLDLTRAAGLLWLGHHEPSWQAITVSQYETGQWSPIHWTVNKFSKPDAERLAAYDALHLEDRVLRVGWAFLTGPMEFRGQRRRVCLPLISRPVRLHRGIGVNYTFQVAGDAQLFPLIDDWAKTAEREAALEPTEQWITETLRLAGLEDVPIVRTDPKHLIGKSELVVAMGSGLHAGEPVVTTEQGSALYEWAKKNVDDTAFAALYGVGETTIDHDEPISSALPLSHSQERAVEHARRARVTVVGGPPGSGKTHTLAALALDAVAASRSVLLASRTRNAADVLGAALRKAGGPVPVLFGDSELRQEMARELSDGLDATSTSAHLMELDQARRTAAAAVRRVERAVAAALTDEQLAAQARRHQALMPAHRAVAPKAFEAGTDFTELHGLLQPRTGFLSGWRTTRAQKKARALVGARDVSIEDLSAAITAAEQTSAAVRIAAGGGTTFGELRPLLAEQDAASRTATAAWLKEYAVSRRGSGARRAVAALAKALRSGRAARRRGLAEIDSADLVAALPLWVGTLSDVEDILPAVPAMFDLVIIDEASHVDQPLAGPALLRGRSAVIGGDPRQLRHVSFVSDQAVQAAVEAEGTTELRDRLDVPKVSLFDAAAATAGVHWLDEHHRCAPHLIGFAATRFYDGKIALLTTHPAIADIDCIDTEQVPGERTTKGVNQAEIDAVLAHLRKRVAAGVRSIGVVTPFRAQADALEEALLDELSLDEITTGGVRVGTVHGVQGSEFDEVVISLAADGKPGAWRFVNDRNLLAVLTTRARRLVHVITSAPEPPGLIGEYLRHADVPPTETLGAEPDDTWTARLAQELATAGLTVRTGYPVGRWRVDLVVGARDEAVALETRPHPEGAQAHLARWRALTHAGWRVHDAFGSRFDHDPARAAVELALELSAGLEHRR